MQRTAKKWQEEAQARNAKNCQEMHRNGHTIAKAMEELKQWNGCHAKNCQELSRELQRNALERPKKVMVMSWKVLQNHRSRKK